MDNPTLNGARVKELFISLMLWPEHISLKEPFTTTNFVEKYPEDCLKLPLILRLFS